MARSVYGYELGDPDFSWLITNFYENNPGYVLVEQDTLALVFIDVKDIANTPMVAASSKTSIQEDTPAKKS